MIKYINQYRTKYHTQTTIGKVNVENNFFGNSLEDTVRPFGIKVKKETAIPENREGYDVSLRHSNKFDRDVVCLHTESDGFTLIYGGIVFTYVYSHVLNNHKQTDGCIGVAENVYDNKIQGSLEGELFDIIYAWIKEGHTVKWRIFNNPQAE